MIQLTKLLFAFSITFLFFPIAGKAQLMVSMVPENKNFLIEKGTGHVCGSCPYIALRCDSVVDSYPGRGMLIEYHFGPDAVPQAPPLDQDFTTPYGDTIYDPAYLGWPFYLNMMVNRRDQGIPYGSTFIFGTVNQVQAEADLVVNQPSEVNLAMSSTFDTITRLLRIDVSAYYTATSATALNFLQVVLTEDSVISTQYDPAYPLNNHFNPDFPQMNTFRENINGFAGDTIFTTTAGTFIARTYTYTIPATYKNVACNPEHCNLTLYIAEQQAASGVQSFTGKIINAIRAHIGSGASTGVAGITNEYNERVYPNPTTGAVTMQGIGPGGYSIEVSDLPGRRIFFTSGIHSEKVTADLSQYPEGMYLMRIATPAGTTTHKIILAK